METSNYKNIPEGIKKLKRFVGADKEKRPINPSTGFFASVTDEKTWGTFEEVIQSMTKYNDIIGIGVVLGETEDGNLCCLDFDYCIDEEGEIAPEAQEIIDRLDTYTEISLSNKGIHCFYYASKKIGRCKNINLPWCKCLEMYDEKRQMVMTCNRLNDKDIEYRQAECDYIYDNYIEPQQQEQKETKELIVVNPLVLDEENKKYLEIGLDKDEVLKFYYSGNRPYTDESANDNGFVSKLMYWCNNDIDLAVDTFRKSPYALLKDSKHDRKLDRSDYLRRTAENCWQENTAKINNISMPTEIKQDEQHIEVIFKKLISLEKSPQAYSRDDMGRSELFADVFEDELRFDTTVKQWRYFNGKCWLVDNGGLVASRYAKELEEALFKYASDSSNFSKNTNDRCNIIDDFRRYISNLGKKSIRDIMLQDARDKFPICKEVLDNDPFLLNCQNGTINLKTFEFYKHNPKDLLSKIANVEYHPNKRSPLWEKFVDDIMQGDEEKSNYLQKAMGYSITGDTSHETFFVLYGATTRNGKSTFVETSMYLLGGTNGYATQANPETLAQKQNKDSRSASGDIARLDGVRFLNVSEPPKRMIFDVARLKTLTGRDTITARNVFEKDFEFVPVFKLFMNTNHLPQITDDTIFTSGRLNVIKFDRHFEVYEQDKTLKDRLKEPENLSGILNWCIEGLMKFNKEGLNPPQSVIDATQEYRESSDKVGLFIKECLVESKEKLKAKDVYEIYEYWCKACGNGVENQRNFYSELKTKKIFKDSATIFGKTVRNVICGYSISDEWKDSKDTFIDIL